MQNSINKKEAFTHRIQSSMKTSIDVTRYSFISSKSNLECLKNSNHETSSFSTNQYSSFRQSSPTQQIEKDEQPVKFCSQKLIKMNSKEFQDNAKIKKGGLYKKISPQVNMNDNNIEVNFVREVNSYNEANKQEYTKKIQETKQTKQTETVQEIVNSKVFIKNSKKPEPKNALFKAPIGKGLLSNYKNCFVNPSLKTEKVTLSNSNQSLISARMQKGNLKQYF